MNKYNKQQKLSDSADTAIAYSTGYAQRFIQLFNCDNLKLMAEMTDNSVDIILTDPPYLYLKNQKLEREFDEQKFFSECKRILTKNGFIVMFGRGTSFYRWNTILDDLGFVFKEEIIWNKRYTNSPVMPIFRKHETISIHTISGKINHTVVPYIEEKRHNIEALINDVKRIQSGLNNEKSFAEMLHFLETGEKKYRKATEGRGLTRSKTSTLNADRSVATLNSIKNGQKPSSIIEIGRDHYTSIHPTQKPVRLLERLLSLVIPQDKEKEDIVVFDPFGGSFSTMEAVYNMQMQGISCEIDKEYFYVGKERIEKLPPIQTKLFD